MATVVPEVVEPSVASDARESEFSQRLQYVTRLHRERLRKRLVDTQETVLTEPVYDPTEKRRRFGSLRDAALAMEQDSYIVSSGKGNRLHRGKRLGALGLVASCRPRGKWTKVTLDDIDISEYQVCNGCDWR